MIRAIPSAAFLSVLVMNAWTADEYNRVVHHETVTWHLSVGLFLAVIAWAVARFALWLVGR